MNMIWIRLAALLALVSLTACVSTQETTEQLAANQELTRSLLGRVERLEAENRGLREQVSELSQQRAVRLPMGAPLTMETRRSASVDGVNSLILEEYQAAQNLLQNGDTAAAQRAFTEFLNKHPDQELAQHARYWLAETYYIERNCAVAVGYYQQFLRALPQDTKAEQARQKAAYCLEQLGRSDEAHNILNAAPPVVPEGNNAQSFDVDGTPNASEYSPLNADGWLMPPVDASSEGSERPVFTPEQSIRPYRY